MATTTRAVTTETSETATATVKMTLSQKEVRELRIPLLLEWVRRGYTQAEIARALGMSQPDVGHSGVARPIVTRLGVSSAEPALC